MVLMKMRLNPPRSRTRAYIVNTMLDQLTRERIMSEYLPDTPEQTATALIAGKTIVIPDVEPTMECTRMSKHLSYEPHKIESKFPVIMGDNGEQDVSISFVEMETPDNNKTLNGGKRIAMSMRFPLGIINGRQDYLIRTIILDEQAAGNIAATFANYFYPGE